MVHCKRYNLGISKAYCTAVQKLQRLKNRTFEPDPVGDIEYLILNMIYRYFKHIDCIESVAYQIIQTHWILSCIFSLEVDSYLEQLETSDNRVDGYWNYDWKPLSKELSKQYI